MQTIRNFAVFALVLTLCSCNDNATDKSAVAEPKKNMLEGTWQLYAGSITENGTTTNTDYAKGVSFIKIINGTHFSFLQHDLSKGKDSAAVFVAGGGRYDLKDSTYTEHLEYCSAREWEGNDFTFTVTIKNDTLVQSGVEKVEGTNINRINTERYVRFKQD